MGGSSREGRFYFENSKLLGARDRGLCRFRNFYCILVDSRWFSPDWI